MLVRLGNKLADLVLLNILVVLFSLPVFTVGSSLTAMHYVFWQMHEGEEEGLFRMYLMSWKQNFKQATALWIIYLVAIIVVAVDLYAIFHGVFMFPAALKMAIALVGIILAVSLVWVFPLQSHYENSLHKTIIHSLVIGIIHPLHTLGMLLVFVLPFIAVVFIYQIAPIIALVGIALSGCLQSKIYIGVLKKIQASTE